MGVQILPGRFLDGSATWPAQTYVTDPDVGAYRIGANNEGFSAGATLRWDYDATRLKLSASYALHAGSNVLIGSVADKLNAAHLAIASQVAGDLLQADAATTFARLAAVATGNALISGGVGAVSAWGKIGLTTHVSGILPVANGGTGIAYFTPAGPTTARTYTFPDADCSLLTTNAVVSAAQGGTGIASYAVGDLLYASGATTLSKLAAVAVGQVLVSAGVTTAPVWSATPTLTGMITTGVAGGSFRADTGVEIQRATDAGLSLFGQRNAGTTTDECFIAAGMYDDGGNLKKIGSISFKWADPTSATGLGVLRLSATNSTGAGTTADNVSIRIFGGAGVAIFGASDTVGPGAGIMAVTGAVTISSTLSAGATSVTGNIVSSSNIVAGATRALGFNGSTLITDVSDGIVTFAVQAGGAFTRINLGGTTSSFPAIVRNSASINIKLADDSAFAGLGCQFLSTVAHIGLGTYLEGVEMVAPAAPAADSWRLFGQDNGAGKTQLMVIFSSGAAQQIAIQP